MKHDYQEGKKVMKSEQIQLDPRMSEGKQYSEACLSRDRLRLQYEDGLLSGLVKVGEVKTGRANIAGVEIPTFESAETEVGRIDRWAMPPWVDDAVEAAKEVVSLRSERAVFEEQRRLVAEELQQTSQRVNLFEKVKIPECKEAIRVIKIALGDEQTSSVTRGKIAKSRAPAGEGEGEEAAP